MPPAACIAADAEITAMMISIALTGGSPGSSPKPKTRTSVPTPPQSPRPIPPERTPRAMKPITTSPSIAIRIQSEVLIWFLSARSCWQVLVLERRAASSGSSRVTSAIVCTPPASTEPIARAASVSCSIASSSESASSSSESCASSSSVCAESAQSETVSAASSPSGESGMPASSMPTTSVSAASTARSRPLRMNPVRPCGVSDCGSSLPAAVCALGFRTSSTIVLELAAPDADRAADALRPLAGRNRLAAARRGRRSRRRRRSRR